MHARGESRSDEILRDATRFTRLLAALNEPGPIDEYLDRILSTISELFHVDILILLDPCGKGDFEPVASIGLPEDFDTRFFADFSAARAFETLDAGTALDIAGRHDPGLSAEFRALGVESVAWIPVAGSREPRGAMLLARCKPIPFAQGEIDLLSAMAYRIGLALEQIGQRDQLELLARGVREIIRSPDEASIADEAVKLFARIAGADAAVLLGRVPGGGLACERATADAGAAAAGSIVHAPFLARDDTPEAGDVRCSCGDDAARAVGEALGYPCEALLAARVPIAGKSAKWLLALRRRPIAFGEGSRQIAALYSSQIGSFLEKASLYEELQQELGKRVKMVTMRDQLFSIIGHDLRGPVGSMCNLLRYVIEEPDRPPQDRLFILSEILQAGESVNALLYNLMEWGKAQQAATEPHLRPMSLRLGVEEVFALLRAQAAAKSVKLIDESEPGLRLLADADSLLTILRNLISNAIKFTPPGGRVAVSAGNEEGRVRVRIADTGVGMDETRLKAALDFYTRRSTLGTEGEKGIGLGLILCRDLTEINDGSMLIESEPGIGTTVTLEFKACEQAP
jgi:signal transduction histidine kinase